MEPDDLVVVDGIPCTGRARTTIDVCGLDDPDLSIRVVDHFERSGHSLNWLRLTAERLHRPGRSGTGVALGLLDSRQTGGRVPDSWFERLVEANSKTFHFGRRAESLDQRRDDRLATAGWHILYVGWYDTEDPLMVASTIASIARRRADLLGIDRANSRPNGQL